MHGTESDARPGHRASLLLALLLAVQTFVGLTP